MLRVGFTPKARASARAVGVRPGVGTTASGEDAVIVRQVLGRQRRFKGDDDDVLPVCTPAGWLVLVGLGNDAERDAACLRRIGGNLFAALTDLDIETLDLALDLSAVDAAEVAYGMALRSWRPADRYKSKPDPDEAWLLSKVRVVTDDVAAAEAHYAPLAARAVAAAYARDLVVAPANELTPAGFVARLKSLKKYGISIEEIDPVQSGLGLLQAVGQGSAQPPRLVRLVWKGGRADTGPIVLVGKGVTFDSGGLGIKPAEDMDEMKGDMAGAAAVAGTLLALAARRAPVNAVGLLALAENMPSGRSLRPGDVITSHAGVSVEVTDTDAEGRLILADALSFAAGLRPRAIIDLATLTGAVEVALGYHRGGLFCNDALLSAALFAAGEAEDEPLWPLPLTDRYDAALKSTVADLKSCDWDGGPDAVLAARFLEHFVPSDVPWAHLDIAGVSEAIEDDPLAVEGPRGFGIRLLDRLVRKFYEG